jgi:Flp pilus assembly protein TadD
MAADPRDVNKTFQQALALHQSGSLADAERLYREILCVAPTHADALHLSGVIHIQRGEYAAAVELIQRAILLVPAPQSGIAPYFSNLARACH